MPEEHAPLASVRLVHAQGFYGPHEGYPLRFWDCPCLGRDDQERENLLVGGREGEQLALQSVHQFMAVLYPCKLLLDSHGGPLFAQLGVPSTIH